MARFRKSTHARSEYTEGRHTYLQAVRAGLVNDPRDYPHTRVNVDVESGIARALELRAFVPRVEYARYARGRQRRPI